MCRMFSLWIVAAVVAFMASAIHAELIDVQLTGPDQVVAGETISLSIDLSSGAPLDGSIGGQLYLTWDGMEFVDAVEPPGDWGLIGFIGTACNVNDSLTDGDGFWVYGVNPGTPLVPVPGSVGDLHFRVLDPVAARVDIGDCIPYYPALETRILGDGDPLIATGSLTGWQPTPEPTAWFLAALSMCALRRRNR